MSRSGSTSTSIIPTSTYPNVEKSHFNQLLAECCKRGNYERLTQLLSEVPDGDIDEVVNQLDRSGSSLLHHCGWHGRVDCFNLLVSLGSRINVQNLRKNTPMHLACESGKRAMYKLMAELGANLDLKNLQGKRPMDLVKEPVPGEAKSMYGTSLRWKDSVYNTMINTISSGQEREEIAQVFNHIAKKDSVLGSAIDIRTVNKMLKSRADGSDPIDLEVPELQAFYESLVGTNTNYLRLTHFVNAIASRRLYKRRAKAELAAAKV